MDLEGWVRPVVEAAGMDLVDLAFQRGNGVHLLRVTIDRDGGVDLDAIADVSERISRRLDLEGFEPGRYTLEVSSPGLERPLRRHRDFSRSVGEKVKVKTSRPIDGVRSIRGTLVEATEDAVRIETDEGERQLSYDDIASARTVFEWESKGVKR
ncbi:MAG TPA: ribosome maturation factor RimP [Actinomycetota bacterium]|nr:ribosome maturation factor RimP [Actinomycetota bacterium]